MAKKSSILKNNKRKKTAQLHKSKRDAVIKIAKDESLPFEERLEAQIKLSQMPRDGSICRYRKRCAITGRPRGNVGKFRLSRIKLRELASWGQIPGLLKSSW